MLPSAGIFREIHQLKLGKDLKVNNNVDKDASEWNTYIFWLGFGNV